MLSPDFLFPCFLVYPPANPSNFSHCKCFSIRIMNRSALYLSVIQFYLPNHTQNVISIHNKRIKINYIEKPGLGQQLLASIRNSEWSHFRASFVRKHLASNPCRTKWPIYRGGRASESWNSESLLHVWQFISIPGIVGHSLIISNLLHAGLKKWVEVGNSGVFRLEMLLPMGLPEDVTVIAWGLSLERWASRYVLLW